MIYYVYTKKYYGKKYVLTYLFFKYIYLNEYKNTIQIQQSIL